MSNALPSIFCHSCHKTAVCTRRSTTSVCILAFLRNFPKNEPVKIRIVTRRLSSATIVMSKTKIRPVFGNKPPCSVAGRLEERRNKAKALKLLEQNKRPDKPEDFITYEDSESEEEPENVQQDVMSTSYNFVDYIINRECQMTKQTSVVADYGGRHILTHEMFKETPVNLGNINKVFCSQWLSERQVVFGTKCNKLMVFDVITHKLDQIPSLVSKREGAPNNNNEQQCGIHSVQLNPSKTLLATGARNTCDIAVYRLPTLDPVCVGENAHKDWVFDMCWLDDEFLVSGSRDTKMALWRMTEEILECRNEVPTYKMVPALVLKDCRNAQKIRALTFNKNYREIAALSLNSYIHIWSAENFKQKISRKLPSSQENVCMAVQDSTGLYAIGCRSYTLLLDCRTLQAVKKVPSRYSGCGIRSASFKGDILTVGTGLGMLMFYDLRAGKYLDSSINSSRTVVLKASKGYVFPDEEYLENAQNVKYTPAIYTHCYDTSGTRLFTAGGPLPATLTGNYAGLWQ